MSVPACPIPTQKTKFVMSKPHDTGRFSPHTPTPTANRYAIMRPRIPVSDAAIPNAMYQALGGLGASTIRQTFSVIERSS